MICPKTLVVNCFCIISANVNPEKKANKHSYVTVQVVLTLWILERELGWGWAGTNDIFGVLQ